MSAVTDYEHAKGRRGRFGRLARMLPSRDKPYRPPPRDVCECDTIYIYPAGDINGPHQIAVRYAIYRGLVVDFSINQTYTDRGADHDVARIDTSDGTVHRHQFFADGSDETRTDLHVIPAERGWAVVDRAYNEALDEMCMEWEEKLRRWSR